MYELKEVAALRGSVIGADHHVLRIRARRVPERGSPPRSFTVTRGPTAIHAELGPHMSRQSRRKPDKEAVARACPEMPRIAVNGPGGLAGGLP